MARRIGSTAKARAKARLSGRPLPRAEARFSAGKAFDACKEYIEQNPVRANIVLKASEYAYTSLVNPDIVDGTPQWFCGGGQG